MMQQLLNNAPKPKTFELILALMIHTKVPNRKKSHLSGTLARSRVVPDNFNQLPKSSMFNKFRAQQIRVPDEVPKSSSSIGSRFLLRIIQQVHKQLDTGPQVFIKFRIMKSCVADSEACELSSISIRVLAAIDSSRDKTVF
jgi:hypothetical protein